MLDEAPREIWWGEGEFQWHDDSNGAGNDVEDIGGVASRRNGQLEDYFEGEAEVHLVRATGY